MSRPLSTIAKDIYLNWEAIQLSQEDKSISANLKAYFHPARPYLNAMFGLRTLDERYGVEDADDIVIRFLNAAISWRGEKAKEIKAELRAMVKEFQGGEQR